MNETPDRDPLIKARPQAEVDQELQFHLEQRVRDYIARGMDPAEARKAAIARFGNVSEVREECTQLLAADRRAERRRDWLDDLRQDLRYGVRSAIRAPLFSLLAILTLALGIGANAAVFGVVKSVLLNALPFRDSDRLVRVYGRLLDGTSERGGISPGAVSDIVARNKSFAAHAVFMGGTQEVVFTGDDGPRVLNALWVEPALFPVLGVPAVAGRVFRDEDALSDTAHVVIMTHAAWQRLFSGDRGVVGRMIRVNGISREVAGILPRDFIGPAGDADVYFPMSLPPLLRNPISVRGSHFLGLLGRLKPGVTPEAAHRELVAISADLAREHPKDDASFSTQAISLRDAIVGDTRTPLLVLMASAALVLLITCANLAGALLSRTLTRRKEFALRVALGAGRGRLVRQLLTESTVLALIGGAVGILLASLGLTVLRGLALPALPSYAKLSLDPGALAFTSLLAISTGVIFGLAPAMSIRRANAPSTLREETRGSSESLRSRHLRGALVAGQIALCVSLLAGAGLLARSLWAMTTAPLGFNPDRILTVTLQLPSARYPDVPALVRFLTQMEERVRSLPGVSSVAISSALPTKVSSSNGFTIVGAPPPPSDAVPFVDWESVSDDYFRTLGIPLRGGRTFGPQDGADVPPTVVINEGMARRFWPNGNALGSQIRIGPDANSTPFTIVGIVGDVRNTPSLPEAEPITYVPSRQRPWDRMSLMVRTSRDPLALLKPVQGAIAALDPGIPLDRPAALHAVLAEGLSGRRLPVVLMTAFGALALLLASVGVYAMFASMAAAREREFGVRVALGSSRHAIAGLVLRQGAVWMALGLVGGALGVVLVGWLVRDLLYGVRPFDPIALGVAVATLLLCGTIALLVPVRRATRVDPISVLR